MNNNTISSIYNYNKKIKYDNLYNNNKLNNKMKILGINVMNNIINEIIIRHNIFNENDINNQILLKIKLNIEDNNYIKTLYELFKIKDIINVDNSNKNIYSDYNNIFYTYVGIIYDYLGYSNFYKIINEAINDNMNIKNIIQDNINNKIQIMSTQENDNNHNNIQQNTNEPSKHNILNDNNKYITKDFINNIFNKYNINKTITNKNLALYQSAMVSNTFVGKKIENNDDNLVNLHEKSYDVLEFLGDSIYHAIISDYLYDRYNMYDYINAGFLTKIRSKLENGEQLAKQTKILGLHEYVLMSKSKEKISRDIISGYANIYEDVFESFIAAVYRHIGYEKCKKFIYNFIDIEINMTALISNDNNYKDILLRYCHVHNLPDPKYKEISRHGPDNKKKFKMCVIINNEVLGIGIGTNKKKGEQFAAKSCLKIINKINKNDESDDEISININN
jgi:ribonuclease III